MSLNKSSYVLYFVSWGGGRNSALPLKVGTGMFVFIYPKKKLFKLSIRYLYNYKESFASKLSLNP